jgi:hypothetical protein
MWNFLLHSGKWHRGLWYTATEVLKKDEGMRTFWNVGTSQPNYTALGHSEMLVPVLQITQQEEPLKCWYLSTKLRSIRTLWNVGTCQPNYKASIAEKSSLHRRCGENFTPRYSGG